MRVDYAAVNIYRNLSKRMKNGTRALNLIYDSRIGSNHKTPMTAVNEYPPLHPPGPTVVDSPAPALGPNTCSPPRSSSSDGLFFKVHLASRRFTW